MKHINFIFSKSLSWDSLTVVYGVAFSDLKHEVFDVRMIARD